jgi:HSP20 family molecular chaperone IbpA
MLRRGLRDLRPFFRLFDEPLSRSPSFGGRYPFENAFFAAQLGLRPAVDVTEEGGNYVLEAELPGVKKDDVEVCIGDNGTSVIIEGKFSRRVLNPEG